MFWPEVRLSIALDLPNFKLDMAIETSAVSIITGSSFVL